MRRKSGTEAPNLLKRLAATFLLFAFLLEPVASVFAQEAGGESAPTEQQTPSEQTTPTDTTTPAENPVTPENSDTETPTTPEESVPEDTPTEEPSPESEEPIGESEIPPGEEQLMALDSTTIPNSPREVLQSVRNRVSSMVDTLTGALIYKYKIVVPPGRNSMTPEINLVYNSADSAADSVVGAGWYIDIPYIQRLNKQGTDHLYTTDFYTSSLSGELSTVTGTTTYAAKVEDGRFLSYTKSGNTWTVLDKNGTQYKFGTTASSRQDNASSTANVYKWMLDEVRDTNNNYITYEYYKDGGQIYPSVITYTGNGVTAGPMTVTFVREARTGAPQQYFAGFAVKSNYRISEIRTEVSGTWARKYTLAYTTADNVTTALLNTITELGQDDSSVTTTLPATDFDYQVATSGWTYNSVWNLPLSVFASGDVGARIADVNGDALPDVVCRGGYSNGVCGNNDTRYTYLNDGSGWNQSSSWGTPAFTTATDEDSGLRLVDVNGDGLTDLAYADDISNTISLNTGTGWTASTTMSLPVPFVIGNEDYGMRMADINGDGLPDILCHSLITTGSNPCKKTDSRVYINTGSGWATSTTYALPVAQDGSDAEAFLTSTELDTGLRIVDVNGDSLTDLVRGIDSTHKYVYINNGAGWTYDSSWSLPIHTISNTTDIGMRMFDQNGDGFTDILCAGGFTNGDCGTANGALSYKNTYTAWTSGGFGMPPQQQATSTSEVFVDASNQDRGVRVIDVNGDGLVDIVRADSNDKYTYLNNTTRQVNYLTKITYPQGGDTSVTYKPTPQFIDGSGNLLNPNLPIVNTVVSQISENDGVTPMTHDFSYSGGLYYYGNHLDRKFAGFSSITDTDTAGNITKTYFHQGNTTASTTGEYDDHAAKIGRAYRVEETDGSGNMFRLTLNQWDRYNLATSTRDFVKLIRQTTLSYDGDSDHADKAVEYTYENTYGNLTQTIDWGKVTATSTDGSFTDVGTDKSTEAIIYVASTTPYIVGLPYLVTVTDQSSSKVRETRTYYDTLALGSVGVGNPTKVEQWVTGGTYVNSQKAYNTTYGIVTSETDPRSKTTSYVYDSLNLYAATSTDPMGHTTSYTYDYSAGKPKQVIDKNGFIYQTVFDGLDRIKQFKIPGLTSPYTPVTATTFTYTDTTNAFAVRRTDHLDGSLEAETYMYFDKLGRLIQERKEAETEYNARDIVYNNLGLVQKESLPYSSNGSSKTSPTATASLYVNNTYDALQRPLTVYNAIGTTTYAYDDWKTTVTDPLSKLKAYYMDSRNNLIQVDEVNATSTYATTYEWNLNGKLTKITDALSNIRNFTYDGLGRRLTAEDLHASADATFGTWTYTYDNAGNITQTVDPKSQTIDNTYDDVNRVLTKNYTGGTGTELTYTYDSCTNGLGKLCSAVMLGSATTTHAYNSIGKVATTTKTISGTDYATGYTYDRQGNTTRLVLPDNTQLTYTFNSAGTVNSVSRQLPGEGSATNVVSNIDYAPTGKISTVVFGNGVTTVYTYDATKLYRLTNILTTRP